MQKLSHDLARFSQLGELAEDVFLHELGFLFQFVFFLGEKVPLDCFVPIEDDCLRDVNAVDCREKRLRLPKEDDRDQKYELMCLLSPRSFTNEPMLSPPVLSPI